MIHLLDLGVNDYQIPADLGKNINCPVEIREFTSPLSGFGGGDADFEYAGHGIMHPRRFMEWFGVKETVVPKNRIGTVRCTTNAHGGAGNCYVRPTRAIITVCHHHDGRDHVALWVQGEVVEDAPMFAPGEVESFLADLNGAARRMGAPV